MLRGGLYLLLHICYKKLFCYRLLQGKDKSNINEYVVFRDLFDDNKGLIIPWSQVRVLLGPPTKTVVKKGFEATHLTDKYINTNFEELRRALEKLDWQLFGIIHEFLEESEST